ncbi:glutathione S-transferase family protein [Alteraurantiacibacter buctensis]|uniref:Glutathione S-transferase family protein n=1 Tax=Alteraurantiacibacter buctensis TaxID=1503981 RepID=A0A844Z2H0_9SPHN|nr:glutathione S-transferase family protein [Alteraurantiacibacter buctensis]MXO72677.1 glutathione S-transferase family protein [Alteraurantiacibacter buctensis]
MLELHGHLFSSYTWKALIPLYANGTPFTFVPMEDGKPLHQQFCGRVHPGGHIPVLVDDGKVIVEATTIVEHLAVHHPGPAPLIPADPAAAVAARMIDRVFDNYVMGNMQRVVSAHFISRDRPEMGLREEPIAEEVAAGKKRLNQAYDWLETWLGENTLPPHTSLVTCAAAPSLFYADWVEPIGPARPRLGSLRAELLALPPVKRCVDDARPYRPYFPLGAPDRD